MAKPELLIAGCFLLVIGITLCLIGYHKTQPTTTDQIIGILESFSEKPAPPGLKSSNSEGYVFMAAGGLATLVGLFLITKSSKRNNTSTRKEGYYEK